MAFLGISGASTSGKWTPSSKPTMAYRTTGQFDTSNYSAQNVYIMVPNSGTATMDGSGIVSLSAVTSECTISATSPKGGTSTQTATSLIGRAPYTYTYSCPMCAAAFQDAQGGFVWVLQPYACCRTDLNAAPSGYTGGVSEWRRVVN